MPKIYANGVELYYERYGKGVPLILVCGFKSTLETWKEIASQLKNYFEIIVFDNRGAGRSSATAPPYTIDLLADDVVGLMDALSIPKAHIMGASMGSMIVQALGFRYGERLLKGVLLNAFSAIPTAALMAIKSFIKLLENGVNAELAIETLFPWLFSSTFLSNQKQVEQAITAMASAPYPQTSEGCTGQLLALETFDLVSMLPKIETEMLIMSGEDDLFSPPRYAKALENKLPNGNLCSVPNAGHMLHIEAVETVVEKTLAFCKT